MRASVVIPTYNRLDQLRTVVGSVQRQARSPGTELEIVVVDDGSSDGTWEWLECQTEKTGFKAVRQDNSGPAIARNRGVETATGELVHDDLLISASLCAILDAQDWSISAPTFVIQAKDPLDDLDKGF